MKRDMELVRQILIDVEAAALNITGRFEVEGWAQPVVREHVKLLVGAGLLSSSSSVVVGTTPMMRDLALTWQGHEFLETIRDPQIWKATKSGAAKVGSWSLGLITELAKGAIRQKAIELGLPLGG